mgnify:CR=1 FL=1
MDLMWILVHRSWRLNERHYGALQGLNKAETAERYGEQQVKLWRRSYDIQPPALETSDPRFPGHDRRYAIDASRACRELSWAPRHRFEEALAATVQWYRDNRDWWEPLKRKAGL